jgi:hypothetical protein
VRDADDPSRSPRCPRESVSATARPICANWTAYFRRELTGQPWRRVLGTWWPRLLPGVAAAATHGVIRVGHAARALLEDGDDTVYVAELAHGLAYWAARWQPVPGAAGLRLPAAGGAPVPSAAAAVLTAVYAPAAPAARTNLPGPPPGPHAAEDTFARAVDHGDEHVIKFADTAADTYARTAPRPARAGGR